MGRIKADFSVKVERMIAAAPNKVFDAWLNPKVPGTPWNMGKVLMTPKKDGFFYWLVQGTAHYGRFTAISKPNRIQHTWVSPYTLGEESVVTITFRKKKEGTLMTLSHTGLPDDEGGHGHDDGWNQFLDSFPGHFEKAARKKRKT